MATVILRRLFDSVLFITREGSWILTPLERQLVEAAVSFLAADLQLKVRQQLEQPLFVERTSDRVSVLRYYNVNPELKLKQSEWDDAVVNVHIRVGDAKQIAQVTFYQGSLFTVELKKPRKHYRDEAIVITDVRLGNPRRTYTRAIDRSEHGHEHDQG